MKLIYYILWWGANYTLTIAASAPVRNEKRIALLRADVRRWSDALDYQELKEVTR